MNVVVQRRWVTPITVCGSLLLDDVELCYTLERSQLLPEHPGIPAGTYHAKKTHSPHLGYVCPELIDVPGRTAIRIHIGNYYTDSEGCTLVGLEHDEDHANKDGTRSGVVWGSRAAFQEMMDKLPDEFDISYIDPIPIGS